MLQGRTYVPMLHARLAEMRALRELPNPTKNKIFPVIKGRPWLNAKSLDRLWEVISEAFPNRAFALDLDRTRFVPSRDTPAYDEFCRLFTPDEAYAQYYDAVEAVEYAVPVLRYHSSEEIQLEAQLDHVERIDRGFVVRVDTRTPGPLKAIVDGCAAREVENVVYVLDSGWGRDLLTQAATCVRLAETVLGVDEDAEIVIGGSSFPNSFTKLGERFYVAMLERPLFREVRRKINLGNLYYGDWGSTRPPSDPVPMRNIPRIDMPVGANWLSWRSDGEEDYEALAERAVSDPDWTGALGIWGEYMIESTAEGLLPSIRSPAMAAAVRVNMHMHLHANLESPGDLAVPDEPFDEGL